MIQQNTPLTSSPDVVHSIIPPKRASRVVEPIGVDQVLAPDSQYQKLLEFEGSHREDISYPATIKQHRHDGTNSAKLQFWDLLGFIETVTTAPTHMPVDIFDQIKLYQNATTYRLYIYDTLNNAWRYVALT